MLFRSQTNETNAKDERNFARSVPRRLPAEVAVDAVQMAISKDEKAATYASVIEGRAIAVPGAGATRAINSNNPHSFALQVFGRSIRESNCDCDRSMEASLLQTVFLQNDAAVLQAIEQDKDSWIAHISKQGPGRLTDGSDASKLDLKRELVRMNVRLKQAQENGRDKQVEQIESRIAELEKAAADKKEAAELPGRLALENQEVIRQAYLRTLGRLPTDDEVQRCQDYIASAESPAAGAKGLLWALLNTKEFIVNH